MCNNKLNTNLILCNKLFYYYTRYSYTWAMCHKNFPSSSFSKSFIIWLILVLSSENIILISFVFSQLDHPVPVISF